MAGITALNKIIRQRAAFGGIMGRDGRRQYGGGSDMGQVPDSDGNVGPGTGGYQGGTPGGYGDAGRDDKPSKEVREKEKIKYEKQFFDKGQVPPLGSRPINFKTKLKQHNKQKRLNYINYLQREINKKLQAGLMDSSIPGVDVMTMEEMTGLAPSVKDLVAKGFYSKDGKFAKGAIPDFNAINMPGSLGIVQDFFEGPVTSDKLNQLNTQLSTLEGLKTTTGLENTNFKDLMETYQPNRFKREYGNTGGDNEANQQYIPYLPPEEQEDVADETTFDYRFGTGQNVGRDVTLGYAANGGRIGKAFGGIMDTATGRRAYGLGSVFKSITKPFKSVAKAAGKVLKSDFGKAALLAGGAYYLGGGFKPGGFSFSNIGGGISDIGKKLLLKPGMNWGDKGALSIGKMLGLSAVLPFIPGINEAKQDPSLMATRKDTGLIDPLTGEEGTPASMRENIELAKLEAGDDPIKLAALNQKYNNMLFTNDPYPNYALYAQGGRVPAQEGGLMDLGGMEKDYRNEGGFVPIGREEKADDVPARLSVNEFVFTADAVRNAGGGDIDKGAEVMENMMKNLENGGKVSEESQGKGNTGAQEMFSVSERIGEVI